MPLKSVIPDFYPGQSITSGNLRNHLNSLLELVNSLQDAYDLSEQPLGMIPVPPSGAGIFARITTWLKYGSTEKIWKYGWQEIALTAADAIEVVPGGRSGTTTTNFALNLTELANTTGATLQQGNSMELVAPIGGGGSGTPNTLVPVIIHPRTRIDGTTVYTFEATNSDHIEEDGTFQLGTQPASGNDEDDDETADSTDYDVTSDQTGKHTEGKLVKWMVGNRTHYDHTSNSILRNMFRNATFRPNGKLKLVPGEELTVIDDPENCS